MSRKPKSATKSPYMGLRAAQLAMGAMDELMTRASLLDREKTEYWAGVLDACEAFTALLDNARCMVAGKKMRHETPHVVSEARDVLRKHMLEEREKEKGL